MLSDSIFGCVETVLDDLAILEADGSYELSELLKIVDSLTEFSAVGIDFDIGGDGMLDSFENEDAYNGFLDHARVRLHERFEICVKAHHQYD